MVPEPKWSQLQWIYAVSKLRKFKQTRIMIWGSVRNALFDGGKRCFVAPYAVYPALLATVVYQWFYHCADSYFFTFDCKTATHIKIYSVPERTRKSIHAEIDGRRFQRTRKLTATEIKVNRNWRTRKSTETEVGGHGNQRKQKLTDTEIDWHRNWHRQNQIHAEAQETHLVNTKNTES